MPSSSDIIIFFQNYYEMWGYQIVFLGALLENILPIGYFVPGSTIVWLGAFYSYNGGLSFNRVITFGILGAIMGHHIDYIMGRTGWYVIFKRFIPDKHLQNGRDYFIKNRILEALVIYFIGFTRSILIIAMGVLGVSYSRFIIFATAASISWNVVFGFFGYFLGINRDFLKKGLNISWLIGLFILVPYVATKFITFKNKQKNKILTKT